MNNDGKIFKEEENYEERDYKFMLKG